MKQNRRDFISTLALGTISSFSYTPEFDVSNQGSGFPIRLFSKPLDIYDFEFMCDVIKGCGIGGLDMTVRPGGRIEPSKVESDLPLFAERAKKFNLVTDMIVTGILSASDQFTERILKTASSCGVKFYRYGWADYDFKSGISKSLVRFADEMKLLGELNRQFRIAGSYQNHAGARIGGPVWDLYDVFSNLQPEFSGIQYDVRHAMVEGANTWMLGMRRVAESINTLALKDFTWQTVNGKPEAVTVPMGEGIVNWDLYFSLVKELKIVAPITIHVEYPLLKAGEEKLSLSQQGVIITDKIKKDTDFIKTYLSKYNLA
ncbi:MAG TPA: TIM barrel protein [Bacteroidales bacterium]|nr:TIM barrel protein [Bacteroidales bacterium]